MLSVTGRTPGILISLIKYSKVFNSISVPFQGYSGSDGSLHPANGVIIGREPGPPLPDRIPVSLNINIHVLTLFFFECKDLSDQHYLLEYLV